MCARACAAGNSLFMRRGRHKFARVLITAQFHGGKKKVIQSRTLRLNFWSLSIPVGRRKSADSEEVSSLLFVLKCQARVAGDVNAATVLSSSPFPY